MPNNLPFEKKVAVVSMLCEGSSVRGAERVTGVHRDTILSLGSRIGHFCESVMDQKMRGLSIRDIQVDEMWGFVKAKRRTVREKKLGPEAGDVWLWVAIDAEAKLVPCYTLFEKRELGVQSGR